MLYVWYWCMAAVHQIGFSKELYLDHSTHLGSPLFTYQPNFRDRGQRYAPKTKFETGRLPAEFYFRFQFWQVSSFGDLPAYHATKFYENRTTMHDWVICDSTFSVLTFKRTLPTAQRHSAIMQAIYRLRYMQMICRLTVTHHSEKHSPDDMSLGQLLLTRLTK